MLALVTGGSGFIGSHLCERLLAAGHRVRVLARPGSALDNLQGLELEVVRGRLETGADLARAVAGADWVFDLAGAQHFGFGRQLAAAVPGERLGWCVLGAGAGQAGPGRGQAGHQQEPG
ncbi:MAG: NAD-dependent epimerase/dehydratase family protein, partial [Holophaga sp.]|nr:NAD-dependent epimerase/dehydratase family protein [Holophaga sp.]